MANYALFLVRLFVFGFGWSAAAQSATTSTQPTGEQTQVTILEGTKIELSDADVTQLKQWVTNAKFALTQLNDNFRLLSTGEKLKLASKEFKRIVAESSPKGNELYVRYVLNRALVVQDIVGAKPSAQAVESLFGLFNQSIELALKLYVDDAAYLEAIGKGTVPDSDLEHPAVFGTEYADLVLGFSQTFLDPKIEYKITRSAIGFLGNDLNTDRNLDRVRFSEEILKIKQLLDLYPAEPIGSEQSVLTAIRKFKFELREKIKMSVHSKINGINDDIAFHKAQVAAEEAKAIESAAQAVEKAKAEMARVNKEKAEALAASENLSRQARSRGDKKAVGLTFNPDRVTPAPSTVEIGQDVFVNPDKALLGKVIGIQNSSYAVRINEQSVVSATNDTLFFTSGCYFELCVGDQTYNLERAPDDRNSAYSVTIVGISPAKKFVIRFQGGAWDQHVTGTWGYDDFTDPLGCIADFCIGDRVFNRDKNLFVTIGGINRKDKTFVLEFIGGNLDGRNGSGWSATDLIKTKE